MDNRPARKAGQPTARECRADSPIGMQGINIDQDEGDRQMALPLHEETSTMASHPADECADEPKPAIAAPTSEIRIPASDAQGRGLGLRLREAREAYGWSVAEVSAELRLPARIIERLEKDDYAGISDAVFLRGYLTSYARLVDVPVSAVDRVVQANAHVAPLVATGTISRSRYLFERYSASATYLTLTALIVVPAVWLATHGGLQQNLARVTPLDPPPSAQVTTLATPGLPAAEPVAQAHADLPASAPEAPSASSPAPIVASMTPFTIAPAPQPATPESGQDTATAGQGTHTARLKVAQQSWVEVTAADGRKLEYSMLAAGTEREYHSDGALSVRVGNAQGAELHADGNAVDLLPFQRGNVAHVKLFADTASAAERSRQ